jgi:hypothetical protein
MVASVSWCTLRNAIMSQLSQRQCTQGTGHLGPFSIPRQRRPPFLQRNRDTHNQRANSADARGALRNMGSSMCGLVFGKHPSQPRDRVVSNACHKSSEIWVLDDHASAGIRRSNYRRAALTHNMTRIAYHRERMNAWFPRKKLYAKSNKYQLELPGVCSER